MIPKSGYRFSEKIMLKQSAKVKCRFKHKFFSFSGRSSSKVPAPRFGSPVQDGVADRRAPVPRGRVTRATTVLPFARRNLVLAHGAGEALTFG
jgi:hypothetical protein